MYVRKDLRAQMGGGGYGGLKWKFLDYWCTYLVCETLVSYMCTISNGYLSKVSNTNHLSCTLLEFPDYIFTARN